MLPRTPYDRFPNASDMHGVPARQHEYALYEDDDAFVVEIEMPGFEPEELQVSWDDGRLFVAADHDGGERARRRTYQRTFRMPKDVVGDEITARYRNGILIVRLPIRARGGRGKEIPIE